MPMSNNVTGDSPVERLEVLNSKAIDVYKRQNTDLHRDYLEISVYAQHNNGGVNTDNNYETDVKNLYAIGECAGTFGLARPGGTALNDTQVSGLLCSRHIATKSEEYNADNSPISERYNQLISDFSVNASVDYTYITERMSDCAAFLRDIEGCRTLLEEIKEILHNLPLKSRSLSQYFYDYDMLLSTKALLISIIQEAEHTGSRGGAVCIKNGEIMAENREYRKYLTITDGDEIYFEKVRAVPVVNKPFEQYLRKINEESL